MSVELAMLLRYQLDLRIKLLVVMALVILCRDLIHLPVLLRDLAQAVRRAFDTLH